MGSTRLPGKVMLDLDGRPVLQHLIDRASRSDTVDEVIVATSDRQSDDIIERYASAGGAWVFRGSELDVLKRVHGASIAVSADVIVRICGDCPLTDPLVIDRLVDVIETGDLDYASNTIERSFPSGVAAEAFTRESFDIVANEARAHEHREHVTTFYHDNADYFTLRNVTSDEVYDDEGLQGRTDLRLALDTAADYELLRKTFRGAEFDDYLSTQSAMRYVDERDLSAINTT